MLTQEQAQKLLEPYLPAIRETIVAGFNYYHRHYADECHRHHARSRANLVNDHIVDHAMQRLGASPGVQSRSVYGRRLFQIKDQALLHFKKLDKQKQSSNYPTLFALAYNKQLELPGLPANLPRLIAGFVPSRDWSRIEAVYVTCPQGKTVAWFLDLTGASHQLEATQLQPTQHEQLTVPRRRVRAKGRSARDAREAQG